MQNGESLKIKRQAISYARFSSANQGKGTSIERQREMFQEWLLQHQDSYFESNLSQADRGLSAYKERHKEGGLGTILAAIEEGLVSTGDAVVVEAIDRLSRAETINALTLLSSIVNAGVSIITLEDGQEYTKQSLNTSQIFLLAAKVQAAHEYSKRLSARVKAAWKVKEENAKAGQMPKKLHNIPGWIDRDTLKVNERAAIIKQLINLYLQGEGLREVCHLARQELNFSVTARTLGRWLDSDVLLGLWRGVKCFEPLLTEREFFELQRQRKARTRTPKQPNFRPLSGLVVCGVCGGAFNFRIQKPAATKDAPKGSEAYAAKPLIVYGNCRNYLHEKACSNGTTVPEEVAMLVYNATVDRLLYDLAYAAAMDVRSREELAGVVERRERIERQYKNQLRLFKAEIENSDDDLANLKRLQKELESCDSMISSSQEKQKKFEIYKKEIKAMRSELGCGGRLNAFDMIQGFGFNNEDPDLLKAIDAQLKRIELEPFLKRVALKNAGYRIVVDKIIGGGARLRCADSESPGEEWRILKRSQKKGCYLVERRFWGPLDVEQYSDGNYSFIEGEQSEVIEVRR